MKKVLLSYLMIVITMLFSDYLENRDEIEADCYHAYIDKKILGNFI